ncbi:MAG: xylulokinase [Nitrososphaerales archaeon]
MTLLIGIDLGTTGCKAAAYDETGGLRGESYLEYGLITISPTEIEQDPHAWWELTCRAIRLAMEAAGADGREVADGHEVAAISVSSQGISFVCLDAAGEPLGNSINWLDSRAGAECDAILAKYDATTLFAMTGKRAAPFYVLPKLMWLRARRPETWAATRKILMGHDYLLYRLCGEMATDHSMAGGTLLYDLHALNWSASLLDAFGISRDLLPTLSWPGTPLGRIRPEVANELGLPADVIVATGGQDQKCAALGAGIHDGAATLSLGTATAIVQVMDAPHTDPERRIPTFTFLQPQRWVLEGVVGTGAGSLRWHRDVLAPGVPYTTLDAEAAAVPRGSDGVRFHPHLSGATSPYWRPQVHAAYENLSLAATRGHLTRAVLEGVAFQMRANLAVTQAVAGPVKEAIVFGGGAKSPLWREIIADVIGLPLAWTPSVETASLGAAMLAGLGAGVFTSFDDARSRMVGLAARREPDPQAVAEYDEWYRAYGAAEARLMGENPA